MIRKIRKGPWFRLYFTPDPTQVGEFEPIGDMETQEDVIVLSLTMTTGAGSSASATSFTIDLSGTVYPSIDAFVADLNTTVKTAQTLSGNFYRDKTNDKLIRYQNYERFATISMVVDYGVFGAEFGEELN